MTVPVSSTLESPTPTEANLLEERQLFWELFKRLINAVINGIFDLRPERAVQRMQYLVFLFVLTIFLVVLTHQDYSLSIWAVRLQSVFSYLFNREYAQIYQGNAIYDFMRFVYLAFTDPHTLQYIPIFLAPFFIAIQLAAIYLADIFELENVGIARKFIGEVALTGSNETIRVKQGEISEEHRLSSTFLIGGPGKVIVDLDSAALFEKSDGIITASRALPESRYPSMSSMLSG